MARNALVLPDSSTPDLEFKDLPGITAAVNEMAFSDKAILQSFDVIKSIGRIEAAQFYETVSQKIIAETAIKMKDGRQYKGLPYIDENGNTKQVSHFDEFCERFLGKSARRVQQIMQNYNLLGSDLYEQAEKIGFQQRDYNALKALPADDQIALKAAMDDEGMERDKLLDLMQEMAAKNQREKESVQKEMADLTTRHQKDVVEWQKQSHAKDSVIESKVMHVNQLASELKQSQERLILQQQQPELVEKQLIENLQKTALAIYSETGSQLLSDIVVLFKHFDGNPPEHIRLIANQQLGMLITQCYDIANDLGIDPQLDVNKAAEDPAKQDAEDYAAYEPPDYSTWKPEEERTASPSRTGSPENRLTLDFSTIDKSKLVDADWVEDIAGE